MLHSPDLVRPFQITNAPCLVMPQINGEPWVAQFEQAHDQKASRTSPLDCYLEGWAKIDLDKITDATAPGYRFTDPFIGSFSAQSLHEYFNLLQDRLSRAGAVKRFELAFFLRGPMEQRSKISGLQFWREAPKIGLTGVSEIEIGQQGIIAERVAYDLNLVSDMLFRSPMTSRLVN